jgi:hypothetical protein
VLYQSSNDPELGAWLNYQAENGTPYTRALAEAAKLASPGEYYSLQPAIQSLRAYSPEPASSIKTLIRDHYKVVFNEFKEEPDDLDVAFVRFNASIFQNELPETKIRYATSIESQRELLWPIGLLALPNDPVQFRVPGQHELDIPHIFLSEKLRRLAPVDEWVLLHEMCHYRVPNHGAEFVTEIERALKAINWRVLIGGF